MRSRVLLVAATALILATTGCLGALEDAGDDALSPQEDEGNQTATNETRDEDDSPRDEDPDGGEGNQTRDNETESSSGEGSQGGSNGTDEGETEQPSWPDRGEASIRPGVQISSEMGQCTSNFLFRTPGNTTLMLGVAAHCLAQGDSTNTDGCDPANGPAQPGMEVNIQGASNPGTLVYTSWWTMQANNESGEICFTNDFALVAIGDQDRGAVHPAMMHYGGPTALASADSVSTGDKVLWWGNSGTRQDLDALQRNEGYITRSSARSAVMYSVTPGVPGDSGSGVLTADGQALGILNTVRFAPETGSNGVILLEPALAYAQANGINAELVTWQQLEAGTLP